MKKIFALLLAAVLIMGCAGCSSDVISGEYPVTVANYTFNEKPDSVVCLNDSVADILIACGYSDRITARSDECDQPEISAAASVGSKASPSAKKIIDLSPDVVFADSTLSDDIRKELEEKNITVLAMVSADTSEELMRLYENICSIIDGSKTGQSTGKEKCSSILLTMSDLKRICPQREVEVTACYLYNMEGTATGKTSFQNKFFEYANSINVCNANSSETAENLRLANPQYIFCAPGMKSQLADNEAYNYLNAVQNGNVYEIDSAVFQRQGNSITEVLSFMIECMYPELSSKNTDESSEDSEQSSAQSSEPEEQSSTQSSKPEEQSSAQSSKPEEQSSAQSSKPEEQSSEQSSKPEEQSSEQSSKPEEQSSEQSSKPEEQSSEQSTPDTGVQADNSLTITDDMGYGQGSKNDNVTLIQDRLRTLGYFNDSSTGYYGQMTAAAVTAFEQANGLDADGYASASDLKLMFSADAVSAS